MTKKVGKTVAKKATPSLFEPTGLKGRAARKVARTVAKRATHAGAGLVRAAAERAAATGTEKLKESTGRRLPIQVSIDIAVPLRVAWEEWMALDFIPEGVHTVSDVTLDGDTLTGNTRTGEWEADILDLREQQSFAWQSREGSDCAGLITFHQLSDRLTRLECNLDVVPTTVAERFALVTHMADRRAEADLRRFKARLELINPDLYEEEDEPEAGADEPEPDEPENDEPDNDEPAADEPDDDFEPEADEPENDSDEPENDSD